MRLDSLSTYVASLAALGERPAILEQELYRTRTYTYRTLIGKAWAFADELERRGIAPGERVIVWGRASAAWAIVFYGCLLLGVVVVPVDAAFSAEYLRRTQAHTEAKLICTEGARAKAAEAAGGAVLAFEEIEALPGLAARAAAAIAADALLEIVYTSGTTAEPKGVMITHGNVLANIRSIESEVCKVRRWLKPLLRIGFVHVIPLSHLFGQMMGLLVPPLVEGRVIFPESLAPGALAEALREQRASALVCVPQQLQMMADWFLTKLGGQRWDAAQVIAASAGHRLFWRWWRWRKARRLLGRRMWAFMVGGATLPQQLEDTWTALGYSVVQGYGLTETAPAITATHPFKVRRGAVGRRLAEAEIRIAPDGEILVRGPLVSPGYYRNAEATTALMHDGWLHTGDLGRMDEEGNLIFLGRKKEVIVTSEGLNVYPQDVETVLNRQPAIRDSAVVAKNAGGQTQVHAVLVPAPAGADGLDSAVRAANAALEPHQRVRSYSLWPEPELPRTASTHKIQRVAIGQWVNREAERPGARRDQKLDWREFLAAKMNLPAESLAPSASLDEAGLSSLDRVDLLAWLETQLRISLDEQDLTQARTIGDLEALIAAARGPEAAARAVAVETEPQRPAPLFRYPRWPTAPLTRHLREAGLYTIVFPILRTQVRLRVSGRENLAACRRPVLFIANHQSLFDVPSVLRALPADWRGWLAPAMGARDFREFLRPEGTRFRHRRRAYMKYVLTQAFFNGYLLAQEGGIRNALRYTGQLADQGYCPLIFPEGQETPDGNLHPFRPGIGVFVHELGLPVVPIVIRGLFEILPIGARWPRRGTAEVTIGTPLTFEGEQPAEITARAQQWFEERLPAQTAAPLAQPVS